MAKKIQIGIVGYGNLGRGVEKAVKLSEDMELVAIFSRREPESLGIVDKTVKALHISKARDYQDKIDVMILCGGSMSDLPKQGPLFANMFNTVDSFDNHAQIPSYYSSVDKVAKASGKTSIISVGWDPGLFSLMRMITSAILPQGNTYTFWGKGVSQGHSDAIRRVEGVEKGVQYTIPIEEAVEKVRSGSNPQLSNRQKHRRECFVVAKEGYDKTKIEQEITAMPNYFADYDTTVHFISKEEFLEKHSQMPHGGFVIHSAKTGEDNNQIVEFSLKLESNPEFTSSVLTAYARAAYYLNQEGVVGAKTILEIPPAYISPKSLEALKKELL